VCKACQHKDKLAKQKQEEELKEKNRKEAAEREHLQEMAEINAEIEKEQRQKRKANKSAADALAAKQMNAAELKEAVERKLNWMQEIDAGIERVQHQKREAREAEESPQVVLRSRADCLAALKTQRKELARQMKSRR
jgi:hypothetical protein